MYSRRLNWLMAAANPRRRRSATVRGIEMSSVPHPGRGVGRQQLTVEWPAGQDDVTGRQPDRPPAAVAHRAQRATSYLQDGGAPLHDLHLVTDVGEPATRTQRL